MPTEFDDLFGGDELERSRRMNEELRKIPESEAMIDQFFSEYPDVPHNSGKAGVPA